MILCALILSISLFASFSQADVAQADQSKIKLGLKALIERALNHNAEIGENRWKVEGAEATLRQVKAARILPRLRLESVSGLVPEAKGNVVSFESDTSGIRPLGPFNRTELEFRQPLYIRGASNFKVAAEAGVEVEEADLAARRLDVIFDVKELYYSILLTQDLNDLVRRLSDKLEEKKEEVDEEELSLSNYYKLRFALLELEKQEREIAGKLSLARTALAWKTGLPEGVSFELDAQFLAPAEAAVPPLDTLFAQALFHRPDWRKLQAGLTAKKALEKAKGGAYYPQVFAAGGMRYAIAPGRTDQHNPFVKDEFNYLNFGIFLGVRQSFEWGLLGADVAKARAEYLELKAKESTAAQGIRLDVERAYGDFQLAAAALESAQTARKLSRQWLKQAQQEYELDPEQIREVISAFERWAISEQDFYQTIFQFNIGLAQLERTVGGVTFGQGP